MLIAIEGPDGSGKSTLIDELRKTSNYFIVVRGSRPPSEDQYQRFLYGLSRFKHETGDLSIVCDRYHPISEFIYGPILRGGLAFPIDLSIDLSDLDGIIYCRPPVKAIIKNLSQRGQMAGIRANISKIIESYDEVMITLPNVHQYNYGVQSPAQVAKIIFGG